MVSFKNNAHVALHPPCVFSSPPVSVFPSRLGGGGASQEVKEIPQRETEEQQGSAAS